MAVQKPLKSKSANFELDMLEKSNITPWYSLGKILPTSNQKKENVFQSFIPTKQCVDYKISETWVKMQKGDLKLNYKETVATYEDIPPDICKPKKAKKVTTFLLSIQVVTEGFCRLSILVEVLPSLSFWKKCGNDC